MRKNNVLGILNSSLILKLKDTGILAAWIAGLILIAGLCWFLTQPVRGRYLQVSVNLVLEQAGDSRRLDSRITPSPGLGSWYSLRTGNNGTQEKIFIFPFIAEGTFFPCAAVLDSDGKLTEFIPLNKHGERVMKRISPGILGIYSRRIEGEL